MDATTSSLLERCTEDYRNNWMPRKEILLSLSVEEIGQLLKAANKELESILVTTWHFKFYMRQLFLKSTKGVTDPREIKKVLDETKILMDFFSGRQTRSLWGTLLLQHFLSELSHHNLYEIFNGTSYYDDYLAQIAYEEFKRRKTVSSTGEKIEQEMRAGDGI